MTGTLTSPGSSSSLPPLLLQPPHPQPRLQRLTFDHPRSSPTAPSRETPVAATLTPKRSLFHRSRRSVPSFNLPNPTPENASKQRCLADLSQAVRPDVKSTMPSSVAYSEPRTLASDHGRAWNRAHRSGTEPKASNMDEGRQDIFLNIARSDSDRRESLGRSDFRRSRLGYSGQGVRTPTTRYDEEQTPSPDQRFNTADSPWQNDSPTMPYSSLPHSSASAHPLDDPGRFRYSSVASGPRSTISAPRSRLSRTSPDTSPRSPPVNGERRSSIHDSRIHRNTTLSTIRSSRQPSSSEVTERARAEPERSRVDGTESTLSTTAPSTVWDELEDLKSRIRKLELTGKLPPSSQEAISGASNERPRTATTTITTLSSSPKHGRKASTPVETENAASPSQVHPLLQSALAKAKSVLSSDVYAALEATITDALSLSTMLGVNTAPSGSVSVANGYSSSERHARRKADSVCRSLTELCLALTDEQLRRNKSPTSRETPSSETPSRETVTQAHPPNSTDNESPRPTLSYQRSASHEPEEAPERRPSTTRIASRLQARRASLVNPSPENASETKPVQPPGIPAPTSRLHRVSTSLRTRRPTAEEENGETRSPHTRSLSRAMRVTAEEENGETSSPHARSLSRAMRPTAEEQNGEKISPHTRSLSRAVRPTAQEENWETRSPHTRSLSRAMTVGTPDTGHSVSPRQQFSHERSASRSVSGARHDQGQGVSPRSLQYQLPQPSQPQSPQSTTVSQSGLPLRRSYIAHTPATSRSNIQAGSRRYGLSPNFSPAQDSGEDSPRSSQPEASQTRIVAPSGKMASSYTPIQQPRLRTNSLEARRFGLRQRSPATPDGTHLGDSFD